MSVSFYSVVQCECLSVLIFVSNLNKMIERNVRQKKKTRSSVLAYALGRANGVAITLQLDKPIYIQLN